MLPPTLAQANSLDGLLESLGGLVYLFGISLVVVVVVMAASLWQLFVKAGRPGWAGIIPIYNSYVAVQMVGKPVSWFVLSWIPPVNFVVGPMLVHEFSKSYGRGIGTTVGLILLPAVFLPLLAYGAAEYRAEGKDEGTPKPAAVTAEPNEPALEP